jgi:hypothetical protein
MRPKCKAPMFLKKREIEVIGPFPSNNVWCALYCRGRHARRALPAAAPAALVDAPSVFIRFVGIWRIDRY